MHRKNNEFCNNWWAKKWNLALKDFGWKNRLQRGISYARTGHVLEFSISPGLVIAKVQGTRVRPYNVTIQVNVLKKEEWQNVIKEMAKKAIFSARLLSGEMPENIEEAFNAAGVSLFPDSSTDLITECSCPDFANPCKHVAAVYYILGKEFDRNPFIIFKLRGMSKEVLMSSLKKMRLNDNMRGNYANKHKSAEFPDSIEEMRQKIKDFKNLSDDIDNMQFSFSPPQVSMPYIRRLGTLPFFADTEAFNNIMKDYYECAGKYVKSML
jgi:uncharacterized Zn finger protein